MSKRIMTGAWVEIHRVVLPGNERAPHLPQDTQLVPLKMRVKMIAASVDLSGLHMASDHDFNRKSFTTGHTGFSLPFTTWPDRKWPCCLPRRG